MPSVARGCPQPDGTVIAPLPGHSSKCPAAEAPMHTVLYCAYPGSLATNSRQVFEQDPNYRLSLADSRQPLPPQAAAKCPDLIVIACTRFNGALGEQCSQLCQDKRFPVLML